MEKPDIEKPEKIDENPDEILTLSQVARILKASTKQVYELTRGRSQARMAHPLPVFTIHNKMKRVRKSDLRDWFNQLRRQNISSRTQANSCGTEGSLEEIAVAEKVATVSPATAGQSLGLGSPLRVRTAEGGRAA